jgi:tetratricopeptide (TPR) repeat protein
MTTSSIIVDKVQQLAAAGRHTEVIAYLGTQDASEIEESPNLALLYGTAHARVGRHAEGLRWLDVALDQARRRQEQAVEGRALNARGAVALVSGRLDEAADYCTRALMVASRDGDVGTAGRSSTNLGIISHLRGRHAEAIASWEIALAAYDRAGLRPGVAQCHHNLGLTYRDQGALDRALTEADWAVTEAEASGDQTLWALALRGRAEIRLAQGEVGLARRALDEIQAIRSRVPDAADEAEDQRALALVLAAEGELVAAEHALRDVMVRAEGHRRPQLLAEATRDLAIVLRRGGRNAEAQTAARAAQAIFARLGAEAEIRNLASLEWDGDFGTELSRSLAPLHAAQALADAGDYAELVVYLGKRTQDELEQSPMLALLSGIGHSRLGRLDVGQQWAMVALSRARVLGDRTLEIRGLNVCGAIALERGGISEATNFFTRAQEEAMQDNDMATLGRCANNLGIIANMQGDYGRAVGAYTRAIAAYQKARNERGIAETQHNLGITYREQGRLDDAMHATDTAMKEAERLGDRRLKAQALAGRAEIQVARGDPELAIREAQRAVVIHRDLKDAVRETEDLRILAVALGAGGRKGEAEALFREVIARAAKHERTLLVAIAQRDLAYLLAREGNFAAARETAETARATLEQLGAKAEAEKLDALLKAPGIEPSVGVAYAPPPTSRPDAPPVQPGA